MQIFWSELTKIFIKCLSGSGVYQLFITHSHRHTHAQIIRVNPEIKGSQSGPGRSCYLSCTGHHRSALGPWEQQREAAEALCLLSTCGLGTFPWTLAGKDSKSLSLPPSPLLLLLLLHATGWERQVGRELVWTMGSPIGKQLSESIGMDTRVKLRHLRLKPLGITKNISIYNEVQRRFIKEINNYNSLRKLFLLLNISSIFVSAWFICNYLLNQLFCSLNLDTSLGKGTATLRFRSQIKLKETTEFQICCMQLGEFPQTGEACLKLFG